MSVSTREPQGRIAVQKALGFRDGKFHDEKQPTDRPDIFLMARFHQYSTEGVVFVSLAWAIPTCKVTVKELVPMIFSVHTIRKAINLRDFFRHELHNLVDDVDTVVADYHALHTNKDRQQKLQDVEDGKT
jgi:hypothetical protein